MKNNNHLILFLIVSAFILLINVGSYGVVESSDARYAEIGREMYQSGDYLHPDLLDIHHYHKPPFTYQITALGYEIFGVNAFGARFFLQIAVVLQLLLVYALSLSLFNNEKSALYSAVIYMSFPLVLISSRNLTTDAFLATFALMSMWAWVKYRKIGKFRYMYAFTISLALGMLTKGPVIFIVPLIFIIFYNRTEKTKNGFSFHYILAWLLFILISGSWFYLLIRENPEFVNYFLGRQTVDRFSKNAFDRTEPFWYFIAFAPLMGLPWITAIPLFWKENKPFFTKKSIFTALVLGMMIPLLFFSISSSKRILYVLPLYSLLAILIAQFLQTAKQEKLKILWRIILAYAVIIFLAFSATLFVKNELIFPKAVGIMGFLFLLITFFLYKSTWETSTKMLALTYIFTAVLTVGSSAVMSSNELKINSAKPVTDFILQNHLNDRTILVYNSMKPSIAFGLNKSVVSLYDGDKNLMREAQFETDKHWENYWINLQDSTQTDKVKSLLQKPSVLILYKKPMPEDKKWMLQFYSQSKVLEKYTIYY